MGRSILKKTTSRCRPRALEVGEAIGSSNFVVCSARLCHDLHILGGATPTGMRLGLRNVVLAWLRAMTNTDVATRPDSEGASMSRECSTVA